jgi:peroxiredoxin Q/BCP
VILGVSFDAPEANRGFREAQGFPFPLLCDTTRALGLAYGACASRKAWFPERITYVIGADGRVEWAEKVTDIARHVEEATGRLCGIPSG